MTEQELKKLGRGDLMELLLEQGREIERLRAAVETAERQARQAEQRLSQRELDVEAAGTLADASARVNGLLEAAQATADQYLENIRARQAALEEDCARRENESRAAAEALLQEAQARSDAIIREASAQAEQYWQTVAQRLEDFYEAHQGLRELLEAMPRRNGDV